VWPVHIVTLVATIGIFYYAAHIAKTQPGYVGLTAAMLHTWLPDANLNGAFNGPSWSISDEWFFYLCFVGFVAPLRWVRFAAYCLPIAIGIAIASYNGCWTNPGGVDTTPYSLSCSSIVNTFPLLRITEFIGGVGACMVYLRLRPTMDRLPRAGVIGLQVLSLSGFVMVLYALRNPAALFTGLGPISGYFVARGLLVVAGTCLITAVLRAEGLARACAWPVVIFGGEVSYSMYMTHQLLMEYTMPTIHQWWFPVQFATVMAMTIGVSTVLFVLVERPARDFVRRRLKRAPRPARHVGTLSRNLVVSASPRAAPIA
jgi:peptidoglycan/LPS O-acetylase OafA/YrhL